MLSVSLWLTSSLVRAEVTSFEEAAKAEGKRQQAAEDVPKATEVSGLDAAVNEVNAPVIQVQQTPKKIELRDQDAAADELTERERRQWLLTGVLKLEGRYEESLTDEERRALKERREQLGEAPRFVDHVAALKEKQRAAGNSPADAIEDRFALEATQPLGIEDSPFLPTRDSIWFQQAESEKAENWRQWDSSAVTTRQALPTTGIFDASEPARANPYLPDAGGLPEQNRFLAQFEQQPAPPLSLSKPEAKATPSFIADPPPETPAESVRRYRPEKELDEKYFKDLRRF